MSAGIERVVIIATATPRPTFHKIGGYDPTGGYYGQVIRRPHAEAFGRPWGRCFR